jgi:FixJ family two-component response regulator
MIESPLVCIVDDDPSVRDSLSLMLGLKGYDCRTFASSENFLAAPPDRPSCVVLDVRMGEMDGLMLQQHLQADRPRYSIIFLTAFAGVEIMRQAFLHQAVDFLEKPVDVDRLMAAIQRGMERLSHWDQVRAHEDALAQLTPRERDVLNAIAKGQTHRQAGELLGISPRTVEVHKSRIMAKLGVKSLAELLRLVMGKD